MKFKKQVLHHCFSKAKEMMESNQPDKARENLELLIRRIIPVVNDYEFFMSEEFSLLDAVLAPLLWRLPQYKVDLQEVSPVVNEYALRIFKRPAFMESLTRAESLIREDMVNEAYK